MFLFSNENCEMRIEGETGILPQMMEQESG